MRFLIIILFTALFASTGFAQNGTWHIAPEAGVVTIMGQVHDMDFIRGDIPYPGSYYMYSINSYSTQWNAGLKAEYRVLNDKVGLATGLKFMKAENAIGPDQYWGDTDDFIYWEVERDNNNTYYYKVKGLEQNNSYLAVPLEVRYFISNPYMFRLYVKVGIEFNVLLNSNTDILFKDEEMEIHTGELTKMLDKPASFITSMYAAGGVTIGRPGKPHADLALILPYGQLSDTGGIIDRGVGTGCMVSFIFPLNTVKE